MQEKVKYVEGVRGGGSGNRGGRSVWWWGGGDGGGRGGDAMSRSSSEWEREFLDLKFLDLPFEKK